MDKDDPYSQMNLFTGGQDVKVTDLSGSLRRHPTKRYKNRDLRKVSRIVVHTTDRDWSMDQLVEYDVDGALEYDDGSTEVNRIDPTGLPAVTYHDIIFPDGRPYHTLPYTEVSWHAGGYNTASLAVALMFRVTDPNTGKDRYAPTDRALKTLQCHLGKMCLEFNLTPDRVVGHRELKGTGWFFNKWGSKRLRKTCPGLQIDLDLLRENVAKYMQIVLKTKGHYSGGIDGDFGANSRTALELLHAIS